jgi:integrase
VWNACGDDNFGHIVRLLILTGQRKTEIGDLRWSEVDLDRGQMVLAEVRTKNARAHVVPLSDQACAIIKAVPRGNRDLLFGRSASGYQGWTLAKRALDARIAARTGKPLAPFLSPTFPSTALLSRTSWKPS